MKHLTALMNSIPQTARKCKRIALIVKMGGKYKEGGILLYNASKSLTAGNTTPRAGHNLKDAGLLWQIEGKGATVENVS